MLAYALLFTAILLQLGAELLSWYVLLSAVCRSSGAVLENVRISGCNGSAVRITVDATGAYAAPAVLRNVHITGNNGSRGAAVSLGPYASVVIESSTITGNEATDSVIYAEAGSALELINTTVSGNNGAGVAFEGSSITVLDSVLVNNTGTNGSAISIACPSVGGDIDGCNSQTRINNTRFEGNRATGVGGAVYMRDSTFAALHNVTFVRNSAREGGALAADRDACLFNMTLVTFENNRANDRWGAALCKPTP
jgi:predicted outer membrane repeat protein